MNNPIKNFIAKKTEKKMKDKNKKNENAEGVDKVQDIEVNDGIEAENDENTEVSETEKLKLDNAELRDTLLRKLAEFENFKKRKEAEVSEFIKYSSEKVLKELIPVYDDISRSIESINKGETKDFDTLKQGIELVAQKFNTVLEKEGVKEIECLGKPFDVDTCDALMQVPKQGIEPNTVIEVIEKGYMLKDKVIKHAKVLVSA